MRKKTPGKLSIPPRQREFDRIDLQALCCTIPARTYIRLHASDPSTGKPYDPIYFSRKGRSRFDPIEGPGTLYIGETLAGILLEIFDDSWGYLGHPSRRLSRSQLATWHVTAVHLPEILLFDATGGNLSKIGTDLQLLTAGYNETQQWALRIANHPAEVDGIYYRSRHNPEFKNVALFRRGWTSRCRKSKSVVRRKADGITFSSSRGLKIHPDINAAFVELSVGITP